MSVGIVIKRVAAREPLTTEPAISLPEWRQIVEGDSDLRMKLKPYAAANPKTGGIIKLAVGEAGAEILINGEWLPFLRFRRVKLMTEYRREFDDPRNPERTKISAIARQLGAVIVTDVSDDTLSW